MMLLAKRNLIFLIVALSPLVAHGQQPQPATVALDRAVPNEDGGQAFIIEDRSRPLSSLGRARKNVVAAPEQFSIFVGSDWGTFLPRESKSRLEKLLANVTNEAELAALQEGGIKNRFGPTASAERLDLAPRTFSDLEIQRLLAGMLDSGALPQPTDKTIFVVFLGSNFRSTLGSLVAAKHYVAYHNVFRSSGVNVRYVVMPFESDSRNSYRNALCAFVAAALKPVQLSK